MVVTVADLPFTLKESSRRRTLGITIERDGSLTLSTPPGASQEDIERFVREKSAWIYQKLARKGSHIKNAVRREFVSGETFFYLGRIYRLKVLDGQLEPLRFYQGRFCLQKKSVKRGRELFIEFYSEHLLAYLGRHISRHEKRIGASPTGVQVKDLSFKWATCSPVGELLFHWRVALLPHQMIEYLLVHELVHLLIPTHGRKFWERVERVIPDYQERRSWLENNGVEYDL